jgi:DNA-binding HxlR family transcriptional regulator
MTDWHVTADGFFNWFHNTAGELTEEQIEEALEQNVRLGWMERAGTNEEGERLYRLTKAGEKKVEGLIAEVTGGEQ